jgi:hypothetical protein
MKFLDFTIDSTFLIWFIVRVRFKELSSKNLFALKNLALVYENLLTLAKFAVTEAGLTLVTLGNEVQIGKAVDSFKLTGQNLGVKCRYPRAFGCHAIALITKQPIFK